MWPFKKKTADEPPPAGNDRLIGPWRFDEERSTCQGIDDHAMEFTAGGELVYTTLSAGSVSGRILLTYRIDGDLLITDQPSAPREEAAVFSIDGELLSIGEPDSCTVLKREDQGDRTDPIAPLFGIGSAAVNHGLESANPNDAFVPFLFVDGPSDRKLIRIVHATPEEARDAAIEQFQRTASEAQAVAYVYDGRVTLESGKINSVLVEVSHRSSMEAMLFAQPYFFEDQTAVRATQMMTQASESWL